MSVISKIKIKDVEYDVQDKQTLEYVNEQLNDIYKKEETDSKISEATSDKATTQYVDQALSNIDLSGYYNKEETDTKITEATADKATTEYVDQAVGNIDLSNYYNKEEADTKITEAISDKATTEYVDNKIATDAEKLEDRGIFKIDLNGPTNLGQGINPPTNYTFNITDFTDISEKFNKILEYGLSNSIILATVKDGNFSNCFILSAGSYTSNSNGKTYVFNQNSLIQPAKLSMYYYKFYFSYNETAKTITSINMIRENTGILSNQNNVSYNVTNDYIPAHKKYVDDSISTAMGNIDLSNYYTKEEMDTSLESIIDEKLGDIDTILTQIVDSTLDAEGKEY